MRKLWPWDQGMVFVNWLKPSFTYTSFSQNVAFFFTQIKPITYLGREWVPSFIFAPMKPFWPILHLKPHFCQNCQLWYFSLYTPLTCTIFFPCTTSLMMCPKCTNPLAKCEQNVALLNKLIFGLIFHLYPPMSLCL